VARAQALGSLSARAGVVAEILACVSETSAASPKLRALVGGELISSKTKAGIILE